MIHLIGCDHDRAQTCPEAQPWDEQHKELQRVLIDAIREHDPVLVAEEHHPYYLKYFNRRSVALDTLTNLNEIAKNTQHRFCEPCPIEREQLGIGDDLPYVGSGVCTNLEFMSRIPTPTEAWRHNIAHRFPIREDFWIRQIKDEIHKSVVFICGALHVCTFKEKLGGRGIEANVIERSVGCLPTLRTSDAYKVLQDVRKNVFPPVTIGASSSCFCVIAQIEDAAELIDLA